MKRLNLIIVGIILTLVALILFLVSKNSKQDHAIEPPQLQSGQKNVQEQNGPKEDTVLAKKNTEYRNNWRKYIRVSNIGYQPYSPDGIKGWTLTIANRTDYKLDYVEVEISYIQTNGTVYQRKNFLFRDVQDKSMKTENIPDSDKGTSIKYYIKNMKADSFAFCYDKDYDMLSDKKGKLASASGMSGNPADPWKCKN